MNFKRKSFWSAVFLLMLVSCRHSYTAQKTSSLTYRISADTLTQIDSNIYRIILPYKLKLDSQMSESIIVCEEELKKELPAGTLNNMFCDVLLNYTRRKFNYSNPVCVMNYGGIRLPSFPKGIITLGKIYELMPFDNELVIAELKGELLEVLAEKIAQKGGEPVSGIRLTIDAGKPVNLLVNGEPVIKDKTYYLVLSDYMANGGDGYGFIKQQGGKIIPLGIKVRDALIEEFRVMHNKSEVIKAVSDGRIRKN